MQWVVDLDGEARAELRQLGSAERVRILNYIKDRLATSPDPRRLGKGLTGSLSGLWRYRVGDYRLIARIDDGKLLVLIIKIAHRSQVYR